MSIETSTFGVFGERADSALRTAFFQWFHLEPVASEPRKSGVTCYRPSGSSFQNDVAFEVTVDAQGTIEQLLLALNRRFVEDARDGAFAADIAASFLSSVMPPGDRLEAEPLIIALRREMVNRPSVIVREGAVTAPQPLDRWSDALNVYLGRMEVFRRRLSLTDLCLRNEDDRDPGRRELQLIATRRS